MSEKKIDGGGYIYVRENLLRALRCLFDESQNWRKRVFDACMNAHRPGDTEFYTSAMSDETLRAWRQCIPGNRIEDLTEEDWERISNNLRLFIFLGFRDQGIVDANEDPREFSVSGKYGDVFEIEDRPERHES